MIFFSASYMFLLSFHMKKQFVYSFNDMYLYVASLLYRSLYSSYLMSLFL